MRKKESILYTPVSREKDNGILRPFCLLYALMAVLFNFGCVENAGGAMPREEGKIEDGIRKVQYADFDVEVNGNLSEWESIEPISVRAAEWLPGGISAEIYLAWDRDNMYVSAAVEDMEHHNLREGGMIWDGDAFQFAFDPLTGIEPFNIGVALALGRVQAYQWSGPDTGLLDKSEFAVVRDDEKNKTFYEIRLPMESLKIEGEKGNTFAFNAVVLEDIDGSGQLYWIEITPGIAGGWDPDKFDEFVLGE